ncbi:MAG TPA: TIGR03016 family PEP-CTERM system-associated outer membrane protein, partial [Caulobacteraceae bacterium]|nr:TIGR03016 family PEP-CTERM system-associated outer membrane protein [Caulobacteraceae bacterium]
MAGLVALSSSLIADRTRAADPDPATAPQQALVLQPSLELQEIYTDNVALTGSDKVSDLITRILLSLDGTLDAGRAQGHLDANVGYDIYARESAFSGWYAAGNGTASYALVPDLLTLKANASTSDGSISTFGVSATDRHGVPNLAQLTTYEVGPELTGRTPDGLEVKAAARFAQVFYSNASSGSLALPSNDSVFQLVGAVATDPTRRLQLENSPEYLRDTQGFSSVSDVQSAFFRLGEVRLIGRVGYDDITQGQLQGQLQSQALHISAPMGSVGFEYRPNSTSTITVESGSRYGRPSWTADATIELSPRLLATASYVEEVQPGQVGVARSYFAFTEAAQNLPPLLAPRSFGVQPNVINATSFDRIATFRGVYHDEVNTLSVTTGWTKNEYLTVPGSDRTLLVDAVFTRRMRPDLTLMLRADYARTPESPTYGPSDAAGGAVQIAYRLNSRTD